MAAVTVTEDLRSHRYRAAITAPLPEQTLQIDLRVEHPLTEGRVGPHRVLQNLLLDAITKALVQTTARCVKSAKFWFQERRHHIEQAPNALPSLRVACVNRTR